MILSDGTLRAMLANGTLRVEPITDEQIQPASIDVRLDPRLLQIRHHTTGAIDPYDLPEDLYNPVTISDDNPFVLHPGDFILGSTYETVHNPTTMVCIVNGKSSLARLGLLVHATAGFVDCGFVGRVTLEIFNVSRVPILLRPGMKIAQFCFELCDAPAQRPYGHASLGSKYLGQDGPVGSRYSANARTPLPSES